MEDTRRKPVSDAALPPLWDRVAMLALMGNDTELCAEILQLFLEDAPPMVAAIQSALAEEDLATAGRVAHKLKGSLLNLAARPVADVAHTLAHHAGPLEDARQLGRDLAALMARLTVQVQTALR